jgi:hypothetical protein
MEEDDDQQIQAAPKKEPRGKKFFINHLNSYVG